MKRLRSAAAVAVVLWVSGCCVYAPPVGKYFDRLLPEHTLKGFVYAIESDQYDWAYECLSQASREETGRLKFEMAVTFLDDPALDVSIFGLILGALYHYEVREENTAEGWAVLFVQSRVEEEQGSYREFELFFVREENEWRIDFLETVRRLSGQ